MIIKFDRRVIRLDAVKKAAYRLSDSAVVQIHLEEDIICCSIAFAPSASGAIEQLVYQFQCAVLDEDLRAQIAEQTASLRTAILAIAFAPLTKKFTN